MFDVDNGTIRSAIKVNINHFDKFLGALSHNGSEGKQVEVEARKCIQTMMAQLDAPKQIKPTITF